MTFIHHIETLAPGPGRTQSDLCEIMLGRTDDKRTRRYIKKAHADSGIQTRHSVLADFDKESPVPGIFRHADGSLKDPSTGERNEVFVNEAKRLLPELAGRAIDRCPGIGVDDITHVITVSCTGFFNPGPDLCLVDSLGLSSAVQRYQLGFMGCYAAIPALRMADQFCRADPSAVVLVTCIELCTLHMQSSGDLDSVVANSVFADGLAAALVSARQPAAGQRAFAISHFASGLAREGVNDMAWDIGDTGFKMILSKYVSRIIGAGIKEIVDAAFAASGRSADGIRTWAVHPGGRAILDTVESSLNLRPEDIAASRETLSRYGNMSSATILYVLAAVLHDPGTRDGESVCALAFGPGLTIETSVLDAVVS